MTEEGSCTELRILPPWAIGHAEGQLVPGAQLPTRDGRRIGNAHVLEVFEIHFVQNPQPTPLYSVLTDAGNVLSLMEAEVGELFYPPQWVSDVDEVVRKFQRPGTT